MSHFAIDPALPHILEKFKKTNNLILSSSPGSGKTTRVPNFLLESGLLKPHEQILVLQPRRVAAKQTALYMAELRNQKIGDEVGYLIRFESRIGPRTRIKVLTEAILNRMIQDDPELKNVGMVILDEFHERSVHTDLAIALLKEIQESLRPDLKILIMSATIDHEVIQKFLPTAEFLHVDTIQHPVDIIYESPALKPSSKTFEITERVYESLSKHLKTRKDNGDILIFMPGIGEIKKTLERCRSLQNSHQIELCELHSQISSSDQDQLFKPHPDKLSRVIFATNVAETSITLEGITSVIDTGLMKELTVDPSFGIERLQMIRISQQNAIQRSGRAGRVRAGTSIRLWSKDDQLHLPRAPLADITRIDLKSTLMLLSSMGIFDFHKFGWFETPPAPHLARDLGYLHATKIFNSEQKLSDFGKKLTPFSYLSLRSVVFLAVLVEHGTTSKEAAALTTIIENLDSFNLNDHAHSGLSNDDSDFLALYYQEAPSFPNSLSPHLQKFYSRLLENIERFFSTSKNLSTDLVSATHSALLAAFFDRLARRKNQKGEAVMVGGRGLVLEPQSESKNAPYFIALNPFEQRIQNTLQAKVTHAHGLTLNDLKEHASNQIKNVRETRFNPQLKKFQILETLSFQDLALSEPQAAQLTSTEQKELETLNQFYNLDLFFKNHGKLLSLITRINYLHIQCPEKFSPKIAGLSAEQLAQEFAKWSLEGISFSQDDSSLIPQLLPLLLSQSEQTLLNREAPHQIEVPSGSMIAIAYQQDKPPQLDVRLQEIFGMAETPKLCFGRIPLLINLLSPGYKSVQLTGDLNSFWSNIYFEVRKELKAQYPRHSWPEDPRAGVAQSKGGVKRGSDF